MTMPDAGAVAVVADDDAVTRRMLTMLLERQGFRVLVAEDGAAALSLVREGHPAVVFLDARMPVMDGFEVARAIGEELTADAPYLIMVTAAGQEADRERASRAGVNEFLTKPFSPSRLSSRLRELREAAQQ